MSQRVFDTSLLIRHWQRSRSAHSGRKLSVADARRWAKDLIELRQTQLIVTPVVIEFLAGARDGRELSLHRAFLDEFHIADEGHITNDDWLLSKRLAERIPRDGAPRDLGDCLIRAIAERLHLDVDTLDKGMPRGGIGEHRRKTVPRRRKRR